MTMKNKCCLHLLGARYLDLQRYARFFDNGILCVAFLNEALCVTFEIELLKFCFSPLEFVVVLRVRLSCLTGSATKSIPLAVKQPSKDRSGDGDLIICCAAISISGSVEIRGLNARFNHTYEHTYQHDLFPDYHHGTNGMFASVPRICNYHVRTGYFRAK